ncbi:MAG: signal peptidase I [Acidimicrobiales bacterium]
MGLLQALVLLLLLGSLGVTAVAVGTGGWQIRPILSGSMRPGFPIGGVVITERVPLSSLHVGDVAVFHPPNDPGITYVHRIISLAHTPTGIVVQTKGDDNLYPDPWKLHPRGRFAYVARFSLPLLGYPAVWVHSPVGRSYLLLAAGVFLFVLVVSLAVEVRRRRAASGATADDSTRDGIQVGHDSQAEDSRPS